MTKRTQLNINISPQLLKELKKTAIKSKKTLSTLVSEILSNEIYKNSSDQSPATSRVLIERRLESIEKIISSLKSHQI